MAIKLYGLIYKVLILCLRYSLSPFYEIMELKLWND